MCKSESGPDLTAGLSWFRKLAEDQSRCHFRDAAGRRCRNNRAQGDPTYCVHHARRRQERAEAQVQGDSHTPDSQSPDFFLNDSGVPVHVYQELMGPLENLRSATAINYLLGRLIILRAVRAVSSRDAAVFAYICQLLLQSLPQVKAELDAAKSPGAEDQLLRLIHATSSLFHPVSPPKSAAPGKEEKSG